MIKRHKREKMGTRESAVVRSPGHLAWVRRSFCCATTPHGDHECSNRMEAHHVREPMHGTMAAKPGDDQVVPLCSYHHTVGHTVGWETFEKRYHVDLYAMSKELWRRSPARLKYEAKMREQANA